MTRDGERQLSEARVEHSGCDFEAEVTWLPMEWCDDGLACGTSVELGHVLQDGSLALGAHVYSSDRLTPGVPLHARVQLREPALHPRSLWVGCELELVRGGRAVARARVLSVWRRLLDRDAKESLPPEDTAAVIAAAVGSLIRAGRTLRQFVNLHALEPSLGGIGVRELVGALARRPDWVEEWYRWADEQRLRTGPFLFRYGSGGWAGYYECSGVALESTRFDDPVRACAEFIALELTDSGF